MLGKSESTSRVESGLTSLSTHNWSFLEIRRRYIPTSNTTVTYPRTGQNVTESFSSVIALLGGAGTEKSRLEEKQRKARKDRKQTSVEWQPRYGFMLDD